MLEFISNNKEWLFSGLGIAVLSLLFYIFKSILVEQETETFEKVSFSPIQTTNQTVTVNLPASKTSEQIPQPVISKPTKKIIKGKENLRILFIDDDIKFKVVKILVNSGWTRTEIQKDISSLDEISVRDAHILFLDIQGVGKKLGFKDEGLGLALALKDKYADEKVVVIYSSEQTGDRFHEALRKADDFLRKSAEPYEFEKLIESHFEIE